MSGFKVTELFAFVATDNEDGDEGVLGFQMDDGSMMPMIGADTARVDELKVIAEGIKKAHGIEYELRYFTLKEKH